MTEETADEKKARLEPGSLFNQRRQAHRHNFNFSEAEF